MSIRGKESLSALLLSAIFTFGCTASRNAGSDTATRPADANSETTTNTKTETSSTKPDASGVISSGTGTEKEKPAAGKGNVQGKVFYNEKPAAGVEVKLCETFSQYLSGCGGQTYTTKTDSNGEYLIKDVPPKIYEGLIVKVFDSNFYVFATSGIVSSAKYRIEEGETFFAPDTHLFKQDLKLVSPKAGAKIGASNIEVKWDAYPDAAYYKFSLYADSSSGAKTEYDYINKRVDGVSYTLDKPLSPGTYTCRVEAYNANDTRLAQSPGDIKFNVTGEASK